MGDLFAAIFGFDLWFPVWAATRRALGLTDPDWEEFSELFDSFEPVEGEYRG